MPEPPTESWLGKLRPGRPLLEAWILSAIIVTVSNILAQVIDAYKKEESFAFDLPRLLRFLCLDLITAPLNYKWQELLERHFPRHQGTSSNGKYESIPLEDRDVEKDSNAGDDTDAHDLEEGLTAAAAAAAEGSDGRRQQRQRKPTKKRRGKKKSPKKNWKNIWTKWFIDCVTLGALFNTLGFLVIMGFLNGQPQNILHNIRTRTVEIIVNGYKMWPFANIIAHSLIPFEKRIPFFALVALFWNIYLSLVAARL